MEDFLYGILHGLGVILIFPNHITIVFGFCTFHKTVEVVHSGSIPSTVYGRVVPSPLPFKFALTSLCCQNLTVNEPFVDMLWGFAFMYRCMLVKYVPKGMKVLV